MPANPTLSGYLTITGSYTSNIYKYGYYGYYYGNGILDYGQSQNPYTRNYSIFATKGVSATVFLAGSDSRIKNNIEVIKDATSVLKSLNPVTYKHIDWISDSRRQAGFIAQEVESVLPGAVSKNEDYIPDIYSKFKIESAIDNKITVNTYNLRPGSKLRIILKNSSSHECEVLSSSVFAVPDSIKDEIKQYDTVFIFGHQVSDFRSLNYQAIVPYLVSGFKQMQTEKDAMRMEMELLSARVSSMSGLLREMKRL